MIAVVPGRPSSGTPDELRGHTRLVSTAGADYLDPVSVTAGSLPWRQNGGNSYSLQLELRLDTDHVTGFRSFGYHARRKDTFRFARPRGAPSPGAVGAGAGKFNLESSSHAAHATGVSEPPAPSARHKCGPTATLAQ